jgi:hypothetical protein
MGAADHLNQMMPNWFATWLLETLVPGAKGYQGLQGALRQMHLCRLRAEALRLGFRVNYGYCGYYTSSYFEFFTPLHILSVIGTSSAARWTGSCFLG